MVLSNGPSDEAHERTALLSGNNHKPNYPSLSDTIKPSGNGNVDGNASESGVEDGGDVDEEVGDAREENPLFEGNEEMRKKMYILCPAVAIGVSFLILFPSTNSSRDDVMKKIIGIPHCSRPNNRREQLCKNWNGIECVE